MYHFMHVMNDMLNMWINQNTQIYLWMKSLLLFKKIQICFDLEKKGDFDLSKMPDLFCCM